MFVHLIAPVAYPYDDVGSSSRERFADRATDVPHSTCDHNLPIVKFQFHNLNLPSLSLRVVSVKKCLDQIVGDFTVSELNRHACSAMAFPVHDEIASMPA